MRPERSPEVVWRKEEEMQQMEEDVEAFLRDLAQKGWLTIETSGTAPGPVWKSS